ncbi:MAG TPA: hypothetical protein VKA25_03550, partial [Gemmatimonadales bacterium]|nr:hypothetical protein [Gemmatimonadales bacterium]
AFLSPEVVQAIIAGRLPRGIGMTGLADLPPLMERAARGAWRLTGSACRLPADVRPTCWRPEVPHEKIGAVVSCVTFFFSDWLCD